VPFRDVSYYSLDTAGNAAVTLTPLTRPRP
jgi:hypothetical protein